MATTKNISSGNVDEVTLEEFSESKEVHPRAIMTIRRSNGIPYPFKVQSVIDIIQSGNGLDPSTRVPFSQLTKERAFLYKQSLEEFPDYVLTSDRIKDLYKRWTSPQMCEKTRLEARCFLQAEDLLDIFKTFDGSGSMKNREMAYRYLATTGKKWVLRTSSVKNTEFDKAYVMTINSTARLIPRTIHSLPGPLMEDKNPESKGFQDCLIIHRIGDGFYANVVLANTTEIPENFTYSRCYPTIIDFLEDTLPESYLRPNST